MLPDPSGRWVLSVDLGTDSVWIHALDPATEEPSFHAETALRPGTGPRHLAFHPSGTHAYVLHELEPVLTVCRWDAETGTLEPLGETRVVPEDAPGPSFPPRWSSPPTGASSGRRPRRRHPRRPRPRPGRIEGRADRHRALRRHLAPGPDPRPSGRHLYAANERSGDVTWFSLDPGTGVPSRAGAIEAPAASCVVLG